MQHVKFFTNSTWIERYKKFEAHAADLAKTNLDVFKFDDKNKDAVSLKK